MAAQSGEVRGNQPLGVRLKQVRESRGMSQRELAEAVGNHCTDKNISQYENGTRSMDADTFFSLAAALRVTPNELAPETLTQNAASGMSDYAKLDDENQAMIDQFIGVILGRQRANGGAHPETEIDEADSAEATG